MHHHHSPYCGRSHTKKENQSKPKLPLIERKKRSALKRLKKIFPAWKYHFQMGKATSIYQHSVSEN